MRVALLAVILASATALAVPQKGSLMRIKTRSGALVMGEYVSETPEGFLLKNGQKTQLVKYADISEIDEMSGTPEAPPPVPPPAPPLVPSAPVDPNAPCSPTCREGFTCHAGQCVSDCNPPCGESFECRQSRCVDPEREEEERLARAKADALAVIAHDSAGLHLGAQVGAEFGLATSNLYVGMRAAVAGNFRVSLLDIRASLGPIGNVPLGGDVASPAAGGTLDLELRLLLGSRYAIGIAGRAGVLAPTVKLACTGPGCPLVPVRGTVTTMLFGGRVVPAVFRLGASRNLELALTFGVYGLTRGDLFIAGGLQADYLFY